MADVTFHPEAQATIDFFRANPRSWTSSMAEIRASHKESSLVVSGGMHTPFSGRRTLIRVPSPYDPDGIEAWVYTPDDLPVNPAIFVYFHGGGCCLGSKDTYDAMCKVVSAGVPCIIVNSDYRLGPEHPFPAQMDDAALVVRWVQQNKEQIGGSSQSLVGIGGDSGGGTVAASIAHDVQGLAFQVLVYPHTTKARDYSSQSFIKYKDGPILTLNLVKWFEERYVPKGEEDNPSLASILRPSFKDLPPTMMVIAEHDVLRDGSYAYANKLKEAGIAVEVNEFSGALHAFFAFNSVCPTLTQDAQGRVIDYIKRQTIR